MGNRLKRTITRLSATMARVPGLMPLWRNIGPFVVLFLLWQLVVQLQIWPRSFIPSPVQIPRAFADLLQGSNLLLNVAKTIFRVFAGGVIGLFTGIFVGSLIAINRNIYNALRDIIDYFQAIGEVGWLPVFIIWSGFNDRTVVIAIAYTVFFPVLFGTVAGFRRVPNNLVNSVRTLGAEGWKIVREVLFPGSLPAIITGFRSGMGFGCRTVIIAEMLVAQDGLGVLIFNARTFLRVDWIIVGMIVAGLLWLALDKLLLESLETRTIVKWGVLIRVR